MFTRKKLVLLVLLIVFISGIALLAHITDIDLKRLSFGKNSLSEEVIEENFAKHGLKGRVKSIRTDFYLAKKDAYKRTVRAGVKGGKDTPDYLYRSFTPEGLLKDSILFVNNQYRVYIKYKYNTQQLPIEKVQMDHLGDFYEKRIFNYDEKGNVIKEIYTSSSMPTRVIHYEYDKKGNEIKRTFMLAPDYSAPTITKKTYNTKGQLINTTFSYNKDTIKYQYSKTGDIVKEFRYSKGELIRWNSKKLDQKGRVVEETFGPEKNGPSGKLIKKYDKNGNLLQEARLMSDGTNSYDYRYTYDENNRMTKMEQGQPIDDEMRYTATTYRYFLDRNGNVREKYEYYEDIPLQISVNRIEYY